MYTNSSAFNTILFTSFFGLILLYITESEGLQLKAYYIESDRICRCKLVPGDRYQRPCQSDLFSLSVIRQRSVILLIPLL